MNPYFSLIFVITVLTNFVHFTNGATTYNGCCKLDNPENRTTCLTGYPGWNQKECEAEGCCFDDSIPGAKSCFQDDCVLIQNNKTPDYGSFGNWGEWGPWAHCPKASYGVGIQTKLQMPQKNGGDDTALNGIKLLCKYPSAPVYRNYNFVRESAVGGFGSWGTLVKCSGRGRIYGFDLRVEEKQGPGEDDTAANSIRIWCTGSPTFQEDTRNTWNWGIWTGRKSCPPNYSVCAIRTQVEAVQGVGVDDTALNNVEFKCCL